MDKRILKVQLVLVGYHAENLDASYWDGNGDCPQNWRPKGLFYFPFLQNVDISDIEELFEYARTQLREFSWHDNSSACYFDDVNIVPNKLDKNEFVAWDYGNFDDIKSISKEELTAFIIVFGST